MNIVSIILSVLSCLASLISLYVYFKHDRKLKVYDLKLKEYELMKYKTEGENVKRANLTITSRERVSSFTVKARIRNKGKSDARKINIEMEDSEFKIENFEKIFPYPILKSENEIDFNILCYSSACVCQIKLIWEDDGGKRESIQSIIID